MQQTACSLSYLQPVWGTNKGLVIYCPCVKYTKSDIIIFDIASFCHLTTAMHCIEDGCLESPRQGLKKKPARLSGTCTYRYYSQASNFLSSLTPQARAQARHLPTKISNNKFETSEFLVHGQHLDGSWQKLQNIALFCWLNGRCSQFRNG